MTAFRIISKFMQNNTALKFNQIRMNPILSFYSTGSGM